MPKSNLSPLADIKSSTPVLNFVQNTQTAVIGSKMHGDANSKVTYDAKGNRKLSIPEAGMLGEISQNKIQDIKDAEIVLQLLPDIARAAKILCSSIISPRDMNNTELLYSVSADVLPMEIAAQFTDYIKKYCNTNYKIEESLYNRLYRCLFLSGSYPVIVLPENTLDEVINRGEKISIEDIDNIIDKETGDVKPLGILGCSDLNSKARKGFSLEDYAAKNVGIDQSRITYNGDISLEGYENLFPTRKDGSKHITKIDLKNADSMVSITDNVTVLSLGLLDEKMRRDAVSDIYNNRVRSTNDKKKSLASVESYGTVKALETDLSDRKLEQMLYKKLRYEPEEVLTIKTPDQCTRYSAGEPTHYPLPSESVKPIIVPGNPLAPIGYLVLIDDMGYPISKDASDNSYRDSMRQQNDGSNDSNMASQLLARADVMYNGYNDQRYTQRKNEAAVKLYADIIERDVLSRFRNGIMGKTVEIPGIGEFSRIMFSRSLANQRTRLLFVPSEMMVYTAFSYDDNGIGKSLLQDHMILYVQRIHLMLAATRAGLLNSTPRTDITINFDEDDPDPEITKEKIMHEQARNMGFNYLTSNLRDVASIESQAQQMGVRYIYNNHPDIPDMSIDFQDTHSDITPPDTDHMDELKKNSILTTGLSPETVDNSIGAEFATGIVRDNLLNQLVVSQYQDTFTPFLAKEVRLLVGNSPEVYTKLREIVESNFEEIIINLLGEDNSGDIEFSDEEKEDLINRVISKYISSIELRLPTPNATEDEIKSEAFKKEADQIDEVIKFFISSESFPADVFGDEISGKLGAVAAIIKSFHLRKWCVENDYKTAMFDWYESDKQGDKTYTLLEEQTGYSKDLLQLFAKFLENHKPLVDSTMSVLTSQGITEGDGDSYSSGGGDYSGDTSSGGDDGFSDTSSGDDFSFDDTSSDLTDDGMTTETTEETTEETSEEPASDAVGGDGTADDGPVDG